MWQLPRRETPRDRTYRPAPIPERVIAASLATDRESRHFSDGGAYDGPVDSSRQPRDCVRSLGEQVAEVVDGPVETLLQLDAGVPSQLLTRQGNVGAALLRVVPGQGDMVDPRD